MFFLDSILHVSVILLCFISSEYGIGYAWNPQTIVINAGDFVQVPLYNQLLNCQCLEIFS